MRGRSHLLEGAAEEGELERIRTLFDDLERKRDIAEFLELDRRGRRRPDFYRIRKQALFAFGFLFGGLSL